MAPSLIGYSWNPVNYGCIDIVSTISYILTSFLGKLRLKERFTLTELHQYIGINCIMATSNNPIPVLIHCTVIVAYRKLFNKISCFPVPQKLLINRCNYKLSLLFYNVDFIQLGLYY